LIFRDTPPAQPSGSPESTFARLLHHRITAWAILALSLVLTAVAWFISHSAVQERARDRLVFRSTEVRDAIVKRMVEYEQMLRGGVGLFAASQAVDRDEWFRYVSMLRISEFWPGIQGMGFSTRIAPGELQAHVAAVRREGFVQYAVKPAHARAEYFPIVYLEPFEGRNLRAFGFDMFSEPTRRIAMERARDTGQAAVTGMVKLVQETDQDVQRGFLMYLPVYRNGAPVATVDQRRAALIGFVYSPFRIRDLMQGILGGGAADVGFEIFDGHAPSVEALLYDSNPGMPGLPADNEFSRTLHTEIGGRAWTIRFAARPELLADYDRGQPLLVAFGGLCVDGLLFHIVASLSAVRRRAERQVAERTHELQRSQRHLCAVTDTAPNAILTADRHGEIVYANPAAARIFGRSEAQLRGGPIATLWALPSNAAERRMTLRLLARARRSGTTIEVAGSRFDGSEFPLEVSLARWEVDGERFLTVIARDITQRKEVERLKEEFVTLVSHEMRTPLTTIAGPLALLSEGSAGELPAPARRLVDMAGNNVARLNRLVNDILDTHRMESGRLALHMQPVDLGNFLRHALVVNAAVIDRQGIEARYLPAGRPVWTHADPDKLMQVVTNLLSNAAKFSPAGTVVTVRLTVRGDRAHFAITDQGCGIPAEFRPRIFGKFARAASASGAVTEGVGLGLAISKALVEAMRGSIGFESTVGVGTTFHVELPLAAAPIHETTAALAVA
jgi:PAS domain S-box-containing protein